MLRLSLPSPRPPGAVSTSGCAPLTRLETGSASFHSQGCISEKYRENSRKCAWGPTNSTTQARCASFASSPTVTGMGVPVRGGHYPWHEEPSDYCIVSDQEHVAELVELASRTGKLTCVLFYAGWCSCCKAAFPALESLPKDLGLAGRFQFLKANIQNSDLAYSVIQSRHVRGLPYICVYNPDGDFAYGMSTTMQGVGAVRKSLHVIAQNPGATFEQGPDGVAVAVAAHSTMTGIGTILTNLFQSMMQHAKKAKKRSKTKTKTESESKSKSKSVAKTALATLNMSHQLAARFLKFILAGMVVLICIVGLLNPGGLISALVNAHLPICHDQILVRFASALLSLMAGAALLGVI